jgi:hypothetical protein
MHYFIVRVGLMRLGEAESTGRTVVHLRREGAKATDVDDIDATVRAAIAERMPNMSVTSVSVHEVTKAAYETSMIMNTPKKKLH